MTTQELTSTAATAPQNAPRAALSRQFALGDWIVHPDLNRLHSRQGDIERQLEPRLIHLLCYLAANQDRVLTRDELVSELWPRVIVNENSLTRAVSELRKHLTISAKTGHHYIETIPKKGYRLIPATEVVSPPRPLHVDTITPAFILPAISTRLRAATAMLCLCLALGVWLGLQNTFTTPNQPATGILLADEVMNSDLDYFGGEMTLSTAPSPASVTRSIEAPVVSNDESQYAYIQHDHAGSTIFLGKLDALAAPVIAVYNSPDKLYNLTWSPLGRSLIFAKSSPMTTTALFSDDRLAVELMTLDLATLEVHRLLREEAVPDTAKKPQSLT